MMQKLEETITRRTDALRKAGRGVWHIEGLALDWGRNSEHHAKSLQVGREIGEERPRKAHYKGTDTVVGT